MTVTLRAELTHYYYSENDACLKQGVFVSEDVGDEWSMSRAITTGVLDSMENWQGALGATEVIRQQISKA